MKLLILLAMSVFAVSLYAKEYKCLKCHGEPGKVEECMKCHGTGTMTKAEYYSHFGRFMLPTESGEKSKQKTKKQSKKRVMTTRSKKAMQTIQPTKKKPDNKQYFKCCECEGHKRLRYDGKFYTKCRLCRGKGKVTLSDIRANPDYYVGVPYWKSSGNGSSYQCWKHESSSVRPAGQKMVKYSAGTNTISKGYRIDWKQRDKKAAFFKKYKSRSSRYSSKRKRSLF